MLPRKGRIAAIAVAALVAFSAAPATAATTPQSTRDRALTKAIRTAVKDARIPGVIAGVWQKGERPYLRAFGVRDLQTRQRMSPNLHMRIGSETKTFSVTALLQLAGAGRLSLDDPIARYVPGVVNGDRVTLRELASMTSGIPSYTQSDAFGLDLVGDPHRAFTPEQLLGYVAGEPALFPPGEAFDYSNTNTVLIGLVVERVSGQPLHEYVEQHVLRPLGLSRTVFPTDATFPSPHARGYTEQTVDGERADATNWNPSWGWAAGAMTSTARDLRVWAEHLVTGERLLPAAIQRERLASVKPGTSAGGTVYGIGMFNIRGWLGHNGSLPGYQTVAIHRPASGTTVVALINSDIGYRGKAYSTIVGGAITRVLTPRHVYDMPAAP